MLARGFFTSFRKTRLCWQGFLCLWFRDDTDRLSDELFNGNCQTKANYHLFSPVTSVLGQISPVLELYTHPPTSPIVMPLGCSVAIIESGA